MAGGCWSVHSLSFSSAIRSPFSFLITVETRSLLPSTFSESNGSFPSLGKTPFGEASMKGTIPTDRIGNREDFPLEEVTTPDQPGTFLSCQCQSRPRVGVKRNLHGAMHRQRI